MNRKLISIATFPFAVGGSLSRKSQNNKVLVSKYYLHILVLENIMSMHIKTIVGFTESAQGLCLFFAKILPVLA